VSAPGSSPTSELPSRRRLLRSTAIALAVATAILVTIVLPAEYGVDPTGIGRLLGLKEMGDIKMALAKEEAAHAAAEAAASSGSATSSDALAMSTAAPAAATPTSPAAADSTKKSDVTELTLLPNEGKEIKLVMRKDARVTYSWSTNRGVVNYDTHADAPTIKYHGYTKGTGATADSGLLTASFDGHHGWFWRNRSTDTVVLTLRTTGDYQELKRMP
jgi:hypothetical protein